MADAQVLIHVAREATELQDAADRTLAEGLQRLFGVRATITGDEKAQAEYRFVLGLASDPHVRRAAAPFPALSEQGHLVRRLSPRAMVLAGGSPAAVCWAAYELLEQYGVRFLLHEDLYPREAGPFHVPPVDVLLEPTLRVRSWRLFNNLPTGPTVWSLAQQKAFLTQLFKLRFNHVFLCTWPDQPAVDYGVLGVRRSSAHLLQQVIPVGDDNIARERLGPKAVVTNPDVVTEGTFEEQHESLRRHLLSVIEFAKSLGFRSTIGFDLFEFPLEFRPLLQKPSIEPVQLGGTTCLEMGDLWNPNHVALVHAVFEAHLDEYRAADGFLFGFPEHPQAQASCRQAWKELSETHGIAGLFDFEELVSSTRRMGVSSGGAARAEREFKSCVTMLHFYDEFLKRSGLGERLARDNVQTTIGGSCSGAFEALRFIDKVLPPGVGLLLVDYTSSRMVRKLHYLEALDASRLPLSLCITLQDDNIGWLPQVASENNHILLQMATRRGWEGYLTRYWPIGDLDPAVAYLSAASWNASLTPRAACEDHAGHLYGKGSAEVFCQAMRLLEDATTLLEVDHENLLFPALGIMSQHVEAQTPAPESLFHVQALYQEARHLLLRLAQAGGGPQRAANLNYWISRLTFSIGVLDEITLLREGAVELRKAAHAASTGDPDAARASERRARSAYEEALTAGRAALEAAAANIRDDSDRGAVGAYYHLLIRETRALIQAFVNGVLPPQDRAGGFPGAP